MAFEVFKKGASPRSKTPIVTIQRRGIISMNNAAHQLLGSPSSVELLFDSERQFVALRASDEPHAYPVRQQKGGQTLSVSATAFAQHFDIDLSVTRRYKPFKEGDVLCVDLQGESMVFGKTSSSTDDPPNAEAY